MILAYRVYYTPRDVWTFVMQDFMAHEGGVKRRLINVSHGLHVDFAR